MIRIPFLFEMGSQKSLLCWDIVRTKTKRGAYMEKAPEIKNLMDNSFEKVLTTNFYHGRQVTKYIN